MPLIVYLCLVVRHLEVIFANVFKLIQRQIWIESWESWLKDKNYANICNMFWCDRSVNLPFGNGCAALVQLCNPFTVIFFEMVCSSLDQRKMEFCGFLAWSGDCQSDCLAGTPGPHTSWIRSFGRRGSVSLRFIIFPRIWGTKGLRIDFHKLNWWWESSIIVNH